MYSPKINEKHIKTLYYLGKHVKKPMTRLVDEAIAEYLSKEENHVDCPNNRNNRNTRR